MTGILLCLAALIVLSSVAATVLVLLAADREPDAGDEDSELDPVDEHFKSSPRVVAGSDIDRQKAIAQKLADAEFARMCRDELADLDAHLSAYYVTPEADR